MFWQRFATLCFSFLSPAFGICHKSNHNTMKSALTENGKLKCFHHWLKLLLWLPRNLNRSMFRKERNRKGFKGNINQFSGDTIFMLLNRMQVPVDGLEIQSEHNLFILSKLAIHLMINQHSYSLVPLSSWTAQINRMNYSSLQIVSNMAKCWKY